MAIKKKKKKGKPKAKKPGNKKPGKQVIIRSKNGTFLPGHSGNRNGAPKKENTQVNILKSILDSKKLEIDITVDGKQIKTSLESKSDLHTVVACRQVLAAANGDVHAQKEIADRVYGKATARIEGNIQVNHIIMDTAAQIVSDVLLDKVKDHVLLKEITTEIQSRMSSVSVDQLNEIVENA